MMTPLSSATLVYCFILLFFSSKSLGELDTGYENLNQRGSGFMQIRRASKTRISKRSATSTVDIARFTEKPNNIKTYSIYVDNTMSKLIIEIQANKLTPVSELLKPSGARGPHPKLNKTASDGSVTARFDVALTSADYGLWKLKKLDASAWSVKVQGESTVDFTYHFLEGSQHKTPVKGDPIQGKTYKLVVNVADYSQFRTVDMFPVFVTEKDTPADIKFPIVTKGAGKYEYEQFKMLDRDFMLGIQGKDNDSYTFRRLKPVKPVSLLLSVPLLTDPATKLFEHMKLEIPFTVTNKLAKRQDIDVRITDTQGLAEEPRVLSHTAQPGENYTGKFVLSGGLLGVETIVTITAKPFLGAGQKSTGPSVRRKFTVESNQTTPTSAVTTSTVTMQVSHKQTTTTGKVSLTTNHGKKSEPITTESKALSAKEKATKVSPNDENKENGFSKGDMFAAASVSGASVGIFIGVAALVTIRFLLKHSMNKKVTPKTNAKK